MGSFRIPRANLKIEVIILRLTQLVKYIAKSGNLSFQQLFLLEYENYLLKVALAVIEQPAAPA